LSVVVYFNMMLALSCVSSAMAFIHLLVCSKMYCMYVVKFVYIAGWSYSKFFR